MNTEITDKEKLEGWVLYDANCRFCSELARRFQNVLVRRHFELLPLQTPWVKARLGLPDAELLLEVRLLRRDGTSFGGTDALLELGRYFWWAWPLRQTGHFPVVMAMLRAGYRWIARNRHCVYGACEIRTAAVENQNRYFDFVPLLIFPLLAFVVRMQVAAWIFMWATAFTLYAGCKWLTFRQAARNREFPGARRALGYLLAWPGMNAAEFLDRGNSPAKPRGTEWALAAAKTVLGLVLLWGVTPTLLPNHPVLASWIGMAGVIFILHFGSFNLLSLAWRRAGVSASPLMNNPLLSKSLAEFWGRRWNTAFNELAFRLTFRPLCRLTTPGVAVMLVFGLSGLIHELVISVPAHGGYGLPTLYFLVQGLGIIAERSLLGRSLGLGRGVNGWIFTMLVTAFPAFWLFHPPFIKNVILPMLTAFGAT